MESTQEPGSTDRQTERPAEPPASRALRLLIVEDRPEDAELAVIELLRAGYRPEWNRVETLEDFVAALDDAPEVVLCDYSLPTMTAPDALTALAERELDIPLIVLSGVMDEDTCVTSIRLGAVDYLLKDRMVRLGPAVEHALTTRRLDREAREAQRQRRATEAILQGVLDHAPAAIAVRDLLGRPLLTNARFDMLSREGSADPLRPGAGDRAPSRTEEVFDVDGVERTFLVANYPISDASGQPVAIGTIGVDISEQKEVEAQLREVDRLKGEFVASVSHELRTPLTSICGYAEMLLGDPNLAMSPSHEQAPERRMIEVIERNGRRLLGLVDDLLTLSRVDAGSFGKMEQPVDLAEVVKAAVAVVTPSLKEADVTLEIDAPDGLPAVGGDRSQLERVVLNLLTNAVKFSEKRGTVTVRIGPTVPVEADRPDAGQRLQLQVADTGIGIRSDEIPQLFTRFFRTSEARRRVIQGTGLGLAVVKEIVDRHGGKVSVQSEPGVGTTMTVLLPVAGSEPGRGAADGPGGAEGARTAVSAPSFPAPRRGAQPATR
ncbi:ATP-binding protein [Spongisporangium articulatum]|uniref:histidine kinase n=1 Tax=Spongisporangium articulatum TaxID=3362603 RepID=A0ABW8ARQ5_9ACTN